MIISGTKITGTPVNDGLVTNGMLLYLDSRNPRSWPGSGQTWYDLSGKSNHATFYQNNNASPSSENNTSSSVVDGTAINGNTLGTNGQGDLYFNGTSASAKYQYAAGPNLGTNLTQFTISTWVYINSLVNTSLFPALFSLGSYTGNSPGATVNGTIMFYNGSNGNDNKLYAGFYDVPSGGWHATTGYAITTTSWYNAVMTYDGSYIRYYINNSLFAYTSVSSTTMNNGYGYRVARRWDGYDTVDAFIPVAMVHNRALSVAEISNNFNYHRARYGI